MKRVISTALLGVLSVATLAVAAEPVAEVLDACKRSTAMVVVRNGRSNGTAFCIHNGEYFLTNFRAVGREKACELIVFPGQPDQKRVSATIERIDEESDLALLRIEPALTVPSLALQQVAAVKEAEELVALSYPAGTPSGADKGATPSISVFVGRATAIRRTDGVIDSIDFDARIDPRNAGCPVLNSQGEVVGIIRRKASGAEIVAVSKLQKFLKEPLIAVRFPPVLDEGESAKFALEFVPILASPGNAQVELELGEADHEKQKAALRSDDGRHYEATLIAVPRIEDRREVQIRAEFGDNGLLAGMIANAELRIDGQPFRLSLIRRIERTAEGWDVVLRDRSRKSTTQLTGLPGEIRLDGVAVATDLSRAGIVTIDALESPTVDYAVRVTDAGKEFVERSGQIPIHGRRPRARTPAESVPPSLESWAFLGENLTLPEYFTSTSPLKRTPDRGVRILDEGGVIQGRDQDLLSRNFEFNAVIAFQPDDKIAYLGLGPGLKDRSYNGLTDSIYLRLHAPTFANGLVGMQNWNKGQTTLGHLGSQTMHAVRIEKLGDSLTFSVDPGNDGPSDDDLNVTYPSLSQLAPYLTAGKCGVFFSGTGTLVKARMELK
ncbi:Putative serine protease HhoA precursor [Caulifigura coniformis]|uniref:Serine protease HhoA n=1 Tax=Caulifigura coniformis TaxID=2527983 RepID=A0A517SCY4_9PLAN|nr:serine protease [Caulifigura coniformis]QDT53977.1 Putative serine protease HhoA precursor [Caulifigura coniformis]